MISGFCCSRQWFVHGGGDAVGMVEEDWASAKTTTPNQKEDGVKVKELLFSLITPLVA